MEVAFQLGPLSIRWYGLLIVIGALAAGFVAYREAQRRSEDPNHVSNLILLVLVFGLVGARLYHVISSWEFYLQDPLLIPAVWRGGLAIYGAVGGGIVAILLYARLKGLDPRRWFDIAAPGLLLAQAIGRWGNFFNQELYGRPTDLPWAIYIEPEHRLPGWENYEWFHPLFLYESLWNFLGFALLLYLGRRYSQRWYDGDIALLYFIHYPLGRFFLESLRLDNWLIGGVAAAQWVSGIAIIAAAVLLIYRHRTPRPGLATGARSQRRNRRQRR